VGQWVEKKEESASGPDQLMHAVAKAVLEHLIQGSAHEQPRVVQLVAPQPPAGPAAGGPGERPETETGAGRPADLLRGVEHLWRRFGMKPDDDD
jgi:hypothetical protein